MHDVSGMRNTPGSDDGLERVFRRWLGPTELLVDRFGHWLGNFAVLMIVGVIAGNDLGGPGGALQGAHIVAIRIEAV